MRTPAVLSTEEINPLQSIEQWEDDVLTRYPVAGEKAKAKKNFAIMIVLKKMPL
jgi:inositol oxygenase